MKVQTTDDFINAYGIKCLLTGASGSGKTRSALALKQAGYKPIFISAESGVLSLKGSKLPMIDISRDDNGKEIPMEERIKRLADVQTWLKAGQKEYDTVFLDSLTEVNQALLAFLKKKYPDPSQTLKLYGENSEIMVKLVREFRDLPYNVVLVALEEIEKDDIGRRFTTASVVGKVSTHLPALMDEVLNLQTFENDKKEQTRRFQCQAGGGVVAKDRSGKLLAFETLDLGMIFKKIQATKE